MDDLVKALRSGEQADMDGTLVKVSRQACEEAADAIEALQAELAEVREQRDHAIALAEKAQDRQIEAMDRAGAARDKALEDAAVKATGFLIGNPEHGSPLRNPMSHEIAAAIRAMKGAA